MTATPREAARSGFRAGLQAAKRDLLPRANADKEELRRRFLFLVKLSGLYIYAPEPLANELKSLHGFIADVMTRSAQGPLDPDTIRSLRDKHALQHYLPTGGDQHLPPEQNC